MKTKLEILKEKYDEKLEIYHAAEAYSVGAWKVREAAEAAAHKVSEEEAEAREEGWLAKEAVEKEEKRIKADMLGRKSSELAIELAAAKEKSEKERAAIKNLTKG